ncbi:MAG: hypothetical protein U0575_07000 [Phycisphaerales bacterium]
MFAVAALCRVGIAQVYGQKLPEPFRFASLVADLDAAGVQVPPMALVESYRRALERFTQEQVDHRAALRKAVGSDVRVSIGLSDVDSALQAIRRARGAATAVEDALFNDIAQAVPEASRPAVEQVRGWRSTQRAVPRSFPAPAMYQLADIGDIVRRSGLSRDDLTKALELLATSEGDRRAAFVRIQKADDDGMRAGAKVVDEAGMAGKSTDLNRMGRMTPEEQSFTSRHGRASQVDGPAIADAIEAQLKAYRALAEALPRRQRRLLFDALSPGLIGDQAGGGNIGLPRNMRQPSDVARMVLASKELSSAQREAARPIVTKWLDEDDAMVLEALAASLGMLRAPVDPRNSVFGSILKLQERRGELARTRLAELAKTAGATWLTDPSLPTPAMDEAGMAEEDFAAVGIGKPRAAWLPEANSVSASRVDLLPAPFDQKTIDAIVALLADSDDERANIGTILRNHAATFEATVRSTIETAQALVRALAPQAGTRRDDDEIQSAATTLRELRRQAFTASDAIDEALATELVAALGERSEPAVRRVIMARRLDDSVSQLARPLNQVNLDIYRGGGAPCNVAEVVADKRVRAGVRGAVELALVGEWPKAAAVVRPIRDTLIDAAYGQALMNTQRAAREVNEGGDGGDTSASSPNQERRADALVAALEHWQPIEDALAAAAIAAATAAGDQEGALREAIDRAKFARAYGEVERIDPPIGALLATDAFEGRDALLNELESCRATLAAMSKHRADLFRERVKLSGVPAADRQFVLMDRGWEELGYMLPQWQVYDAATWLIQQMTPKDVMAASPELRVLRRW